MGNPPRPPDSGRDLGILAKDRGDFALAETRLAEALRLRDEHGFDLAAAVSVVGLAAVAYARGDYAPRHRS